MLHMFLEYFYTTIVLCWSASGLLQQAPTSSINSTTVEVEEDRQIARFARARSISLTIISKFPTIEFSNKGM